MTETNQTNFRPLVFWRGNQQRVLGLIRFQAAVFPPSSYTLSYHLLSFLFSQKGSAIRLLLKLYEDYMKSRILHELLIHVVFHLSCLSRFCLYTITLTSCVFFRDQITIKRPSLPVRQFSGNHGASLKAASCCCTVCDSNMTTGGTGVILFPLSTTRVLLYKPCLTLIFPLYSVILSFLSLFP